MSLYDDISLNISYDVDVSNHALAINDAYESQKKLMSSALTDLFKYGSYGSMITASKNYIDEDLYHNTSETQQQNLNVFEKEIERVGKTYNYDADMYKNQLNTNIRVQKAKNLLKDRNEDMRNTIEGNQKQHMIYQYYYMKYKAQLKILYSFIALLVLWIVMTFLNNNMTFIFNDTVYILILGISTALFFIYVGLQAYDIYLRSEHVFLEYDNEPEGSWTTLPSTLSIQKENEKKKKCST